MFFPQLFSFRLVARALRIAAIGVFLSGVSSASAQLGSRAISCDGPTRNERLGQIVLPSVELHQVKLRDALEVLRQEAFRINPDPYPANKTINFVVDPSLTSSAEPKVTLNLHQMPLREILKYVAAQSGSKVKWESHAVAFVPLSEPDELVTATFRVQPAFFNKPTGVGGTKNPLDQGATRAQ